jgi:hypothetical protein
MKGAVPAALIAAALAACSGSTSEPKTGGKYLTVFVTKDGALEVDGREASLHELERELQLAVDVGAIVLLAREPPERDRAPIARMVLQMVRDRQLQIRQCRNRDFSDAIAPDGTLRPQ